MDHTIRQEVKQYCPKWATHSTNIPVPNWATNVQPAISSGIQSDPNIKAVLPIFDGEVPPAASAVTASGRSDVKLYVDYGGAPASIDDMGAGKIPMADDVGPTHLWRAYATMDEVPRVLTGAGAVPPNKDADPSRRFTPRTTRRSTRFRHRLRHRLHEALGTRLR